MNKVFNNCCKGSANRAKYQKKIRFSSCFLYLFCIFEGKVTAYRNILHGGSEEGSVSKDVKDILAGRNEDGFTLADMDAVDVGLTPETHHNDEGIALEINLLRHLNDYTVDNKIRTVDKLTCWFRRVIGRAILRPYLIVNSFLGLFDVQFSRIAVGILAPEVVDTIGNIAGLLNFGQEYILLPIRRPLYLSISSVSVSPSSTSSTSPRLTATLSWSGTPLISQLSPMFGCAVQMPLNGAI